MLFAGWDGEGLPHAEHGRGMTSFFKRSLPKPSDQWAGTGCVHMH